MNINTNYNASIAQTHLASAQRSLSKALERLASGIKINHAYDDPAGLVMALQMSNQISGTQAGTNNLQMAVDLFNTADSYTRAIGDDLAQMSSLASQASNGLLTDPQRQQLQYQYQNSMDEIQRLATNATYNGRTLLDGTLQNVVVQAGAEPTNTVTVNIGNMSVGATGLDIAGTNIGTQAGAAAAIVQLNNAVANVFAPTVAAIGAQAASFLASTNAQSFYATNLISARSRIMDTDLAAEVTNLVNSQVVVKAGIKALAVANEAKGLVLNLIA